MNQNPKLAKFQSSQYTRDYYSYSFYVDSIAPAATAQAGFQVDASAAFMAIAAVAFADNAAAAQEQATRILPLVTIAIKDGGSGRDWQDRALPVPMVAGDGQFPYFFPEPRLIEPNSSITAQFTNYDAAVTYTNLYYTLIGYQIFKYSQ